MDDSGGKNNGSPISTCILGGRPLKIFRSRKKPGERSSGSQDSRSRDVRPRANSLEGEARERFTPLVAETAVDDRDSPPPLESPKKKNEPLPRLEVRLPIDLPSHGWWVRDVILPQLRGTENSLVYRDEHGRESGTLDKPFFYGSTVFAVLRNLRSDGGAVLEGDVEEATADLARVLRALRERRPDLFGSDMFRIADDLPFSFGRLGLALLNSGRLQGLAVSPDDYEVVAKEFDQAERHPYLPDRARIRRLKEFLSFDPESKHITDQEISWADEVRLRDLERFLFGRVLSSLGQLSGVV